MLILYQGKFALIITGWVFLMKWSKESDVYRRLAAEGPVNADAKSSLIRIAHMLDADSNLAIYAFAQHAFFFLTQTLSPPQTIMLRHLAGFRGDILRDTYKHASSKWHHRYDEATYDYVLEQVQRLAHISSTGLVNSSQLASALTFFNLTIELQDRPETIIEDLEKGTRFEYNSGNYFWRDHGISEDELASLSIDLARFEGNDILTPQEISDRFRLCVSVDENGIAVFPTERWGVHSVHDGDQNELVRELVFPDNFLVLPDQLLEFENLLLATSVNENDWQRFFEQNPVFLYLLGDYNDHRREVSLRPQLTLDETPDLGLRPDFLLKRIDMNLWDILEIKLPNQKLVVGRDSRRHLSAPVISALSQIKWYAEFFSDQANLRWFRKTHGLDVASPRLNLLIGRDTSFRDQREKSRFSQSEATRIFTYDDLFRIAKHRSLRL